MALEGGTWRGRSVADRERQPEYLAERLATTLRHEAQIELGQILCVLR